MLLKLSEAAELENISRRAMQKRIEKENLSAIKVVYNSQGRSRGFVYWINIYVLSVKALRIFYIRLFEQAQAALKELSKEEQRERVSFEELTEKQREQVAFWKEAIRQWRLYLGDEHGKKTERTKEFLKIFNIQNNL